MLITEQFTSAIIAAYGNHNKDELGLVKETGSTYLVCHGNIVVKLKKRPFFPSVFYVV